jgi:adenylate cyclase
MVGSTELAERRGPLAFHRLLNRFVTDLTDPIVAARGEIYSYVGDELIATWKLEEGISQARCVRACSTPLTCSLERRTNTGANLALLSIFVPGCIAVPSSPARGSIKTEIVFLGDTVNTTARIQDLCRQTGDRILASADLIDRLQLPPGILKRSLGDLRLRGKGVDLVLYALNKAAEERSDQGGGRESVDAAL